MSLTVYQFAHSPFCIPITAALNSCGTAFETKDVPYHDRSEIIRLTNGAYYQVPLLVHDGRVIFEDAADSQIIPRYVDATFAGGRLFPERLEGLQAIVIAFLENEVEDATFRLTDPHYLATIEDLVARTMAIRHKERKFGRGCEEAWRRDAIPLRARADRLLAHFESTLRHAPFLFGDAPVYADFLLFGIIGNLTWEGWNTLSPEQSALQRWVEALRVYRY